MILDCEQCNGTGECKPGIRCPCREEDDEAEAKRKKMGIAATPPPEAMKIGDTIRVRRVRSEDEWCIGIVELASLNGESVLMRVHDGALRPEGGGFISGVIAIACDFTKGIAKEMLTDTELEVERRRDANSGQ